MIALLLTLFSTPSFAYIPEYSVIASRAAEQHGKGAYQIEQDVTFKRESESFTVKETWLVTGEGGMRVTLEGRGPLKGLIQGTLVYDGGTKSFVEGISSARAQRLGEDWLEPFFHFRSSKYFRSRLVSMKIAPPESLNDRPGLNVEGPPKYAPPNFIRLSRAGGSVSWAIGAAPTAGPTPTVWVEQDQFVVRKVRGANQTVMKADDYQKFDTSMWYPKNITYSFGPYTVRTTTLSVKSLGKVGGDRLKAGSLVGSRDALKIPDMDGVREFYSRFR